MPPPRQLWQFAEDGVTFDTRFAMARASDCQRIARDEYTVVTRPENTPINPSPWFAFKVSAASARAITVRLVCDGGPLRYRPKISVDGINWVTLPAEAFTSTAKSSEGTLRLEVGPEPLWVAAQEVITSDRLEAWSRALERLPFVTRSEIGRSLQGAPLHKIEITGATNPGYVVILGRQHPPETTGTLALMRFVETLVGDSALARDFRQQFNVLLVPLLNPDGVDQGHWRHNQNGVDLNRDWGVFRQPETSAVLDQINALREKGRLFFFLDFHSTQYDVFYTQTDAEQSFPTDFTKHWIDGIQRRFPDYKVKRSASSSPTSTTSVGWARRTFGIHAITYEIGDNTDRALLQQIATGAAEEMMTLLLAAKTAATTTPPAAAQTTGTKNQ